VLTKAGRLGPVRESHKDALFAQLQAAGGQLCYRWAITGSKHADVSAKLPFVMSSSLTAIGTAHSSVRQKPLAKLAACM
jgi:hypothetical protein